MPDPPAETVTLLFSNVSDASRLRRRDNGRNAERIAEESDLIRAALLAHGGQEVAVQGEGLLVAFQRASQAVVAAVEAQRELQSHVRVVDGVARARIALRTGEPLQTAAGYVGLDVFRTVCICNAAHGGQILVSQTTADHARSELPPEFGLRDLGDHWFKELTQPERLFQIVVAGLPADFPPLESLGSYRTNLPSPPTSLIDRERELAAVTTLLQQDGVRLVTLTGSGGTGKTRLALQVASALHGAFADGVFFVDLASDFDPALVVSTIAQTFGLRDVGERPVLDLLVDYLHDREMLLVVDNFEQVISAAPLLADLLAACPQLSLLVTSRSALHLRGEREIAIPPLAVPNPGERLPVEALGQIPAVALCVERARAVRSDFAVSQENASAIAEICQRLDGLPLAIELAAAHIRIMSPAAMAERLDRRLSLLTVGARDLPARQQTMRDTIAWSYGLLTVPEQRLFCWISVFAGGCTLDAVEAVWSVAGEPGMDSLKGLAALVDKSLLHQTGTDGEPRFSMFETVREFAAEQLDVVGQTAVARMAHLRHMRRFGQSAQVGLRGPDQFAWMTRLETELSNIRAALAWAVANSEAARDGLILASAITPFWWHQHLMEGRDWLQRLLATGVAAGTPLRALALYNTGFLAYHAGGGAAAFEVVDEGVALSRTLGEEQLLGMALALQAMGAAFRGDRDAALSIVSESLEIVRRYSDSWMLAVALGFQARVAGALGDDAMVQVCCEESLELFRSVGERWLIASPIAWLGDLAYRHSDFREARARYEESVALYQQAGNLTEAAHALSGLGLVALALGDEARAERYFREGLIFPTEVGRPLEVPPPIVGLAAVCLARAQQRRAARLLGAADELSKSVDMPLASFFQDLYEQSVAAVRAALGELVFEAAQSEGRAMTLRQAVAYALMDEAGSGPSFDGASGSAGAFDTAQRSTSVEIPGSLTVRQLEVLTLLAAGHTDKEIATRLGMAVPTASRHIANIYVKIGARGRADAIAFAHRHGLLDG
jgi:predicted ATPase/class 3 adenylate cyclase/DNA-binding NarL/FixJ family response regulator